MPGAVNTVTIAKYYNRNIQFIKDSTIL